jgi:hypothetical protein
LEASPHFVSAGLTTDADVKQLSATLAADETISVAQARMPAALAHGPL